MKYTVLDMTQQILSSIDADEINSITETVEAQQVAKIIRTVYLDIVERADPPELYGLINLTASGTSTKPVLMTVPSTVQDIVWVKYNVETEDETNMQFKTLTYLRLEEFLHRMHTLDEDESTVDTMDITEDGHTFTIMYVNDTAPTYWTSYNDNTLLFDSYDNEVDSTLQSSKTLCWAKKIPTFTLSDSFTPDLDDAQFPLLLNESKSLAWAELRQSQNPKAEQFARRHWTKMQKSKYNATDPQYFNSLPNFGRK